MWSRLTRTETADLLDFLLPQEQTCVGFTGRIARKGKLKLPALGVGSVLVDRDNGIKSAVLLGEYDTVYPLFGAPRSLQKDETLARLISARCPKPSTVFGKPEDLEYLFELLGIFPSVANEYYTMTLGSEDDALAIKAPFHGLRLRRARPSDLEKLFPLQEAYEREEVLTSIHRFSAASSRVLLEKALRKMTILVGEIEGELVAKAGTNALGFAYDQIGGVYVKNEHRGRGIGTYISSRLVEELLGKGRKVSLFVKKTNLAAISAYKKVGFHILGSFRIGYFL